MPECRGCHPFGGRLALSLLERTLPGQKPNLVLVPPPPFSPFAPNTHTHMLTHMASAATSSWLSGLSLMTLRTQAMCIR